MDPNRKDGLMEIFCKKGRRAIDDRINTNSPRSVTFNAATIETSFGGTDTAGHIKDSSILETKKTAAPRFVHQGTKKGVPANHSQNGKDENTVPLKHKLRTDTETRDKPSSSDKNDKPKKVPQSDPSAKKTTPARPQNNFLTPTRVPISVRRTSDEQRTPVGRGHTIEHFRSVSQTPDCFNPVTLGTPESKFRTPRRSHDLVQSEDCGVTVAVRVRPFGSREISDPEAGKCVVSMIDHETVITSDKGDVHHFAYDYSFWSFDKQGGDFADQDHVYNSLAAPMLGKAFEGYNTCLFAYGQTGSGKSYSIMGHNEEAGIIPRFCEELFGRVNFDTRQTKINVEISYFEIYNEKIHDLLGPSGKDKMGRKANLKVREHPTLGPYVEGLSSYVVETFEDIKSWLNVGNKHRATAATGMNDKSSRSHSVFTMVLTQSKTDTIEGENHNHSVTSKINLVDLAGSERQSLAKTSGDRLREGASINKSLMTLGKVISVLSEQSTNNASKKKKFFIPYRDSVLTWLLKESLGGNSKTAMLATISPSVQHIEETLSTLRYAQQARSIINTARVNEDPKARLIRELRAEIDKLRNQSGGEDEDLVGASLMEIASLREKLALKQQEMTEMSRSWEEKLKKSEARKLEEARSLERSGIAFKVDNKLPNLVNLNEDPQLSEMLLYVLKEGVMTVGRVGGDRNIDIQLSGPLIADRHCIFKYERQKMTITPVKDAPTYVNGDLISETTLLHHGDRVILGGDHYFRFSNPSEVVPGQRKSHVGSAPKDFEFARQELIRVQNARLEAELEEARRRHEEELQTELRRQENEAKRRMDQELTAQKYEYESRLADLEKTMNDHRKKQFESDKQRQQADDAFRKLEVQKMVLEQEVLANRKRLELEAKAAQTSLQMSRVSHCKIVEQLEKEKLKIQQDVKKLALLKQQREAGLTPRGVTPRSASVQSSSRKDLCRTMLKLREANKISQYLNKNTVFSRTEITADNDLQPLIKVTNSRLGISTLWTMDKFEEKLIQIREIYQAGDIEMNGGDSEEVFYDPNDTWEKDGLLSTPQGLSPRVLHSLRRQISSDRIPKLKFESLSSTGSKERHSTVGSSTSSMVFLDTRPSTADSTEAPSVLEICRDQMSAALDRFKGSVFKETTPDKLLGQCDVIKQTVAAMLDAHNSAAESPASKGRLRESTAVQVSALELMGSLRIVLSQSSVWSRTLEDHGSAHILQLHNSLLATVRKLGNQLVLFIQGCENDIDSMVQESSAHVFDALYTVCRACGEIVIAMETPMLCLRDSPDGSMLEDEDCRVHLSPDTKQFVISGTEVFVDRTLSLSLRTVEDCAARVSGLSDGLLENNGGLSGVSRQVEIIVASAKVLLAKLQETQMDVDTTTRQVSCDSRSNDFYHRNYSRNLNLVKHITAIADSTSLLVETTHSVIQGEEEASLRKVSRCADMVRKSTEKTCALCVKGSNPSDSQADYSDIVGLDESQREHLSAQTREIQQATTVLYKLTRKSATSKTSQPSELKQTSSADPVRDQNEEVKVMAKESIVRRNLALFQH